METATEPCCSLPDATDSHEERMWNHNLKVLEAQQRDDNMTAAMLTVHFFIDRLGAFLGDEALNLLFLSKTIETTAYD